MRWAMLLLGIAIGLLAALLASPRVCRFWAIDECLDRGGAWNYERGICEGLASK